jgi:amino acid transporter
LSYMAMVRAFPLAGSVYTYASRSLGASAGFFAGWAMLLDYLLLPTLTYVAGAIAIHAALPQLPKALAVGVMLGTVTSINYLGIETTARASLVLLGFQLCILALFFMLGGAALFHHVAGAHLSLLPFYNSHEFTPNLVFGALSLALLSFLGVDAISTLSEESSGGAVTVARATILSLCLSATLFVTQTWLASEFLLGKISLPEGNATNAAFYNIAELVGGQWLKFILAVPGIFLASIAGAVSAQAATARLLFGMARDGELPRALSYVDPCRRVPQRAMWLVALVTLVLSLSLIDRLELLVSVVSFGALLGFLLLHMSVIAHFIWHRKSRRWLRHLVAPAVGFAVITYVLWNAADNAKIVGSIWLIVGCGVSLMLKRVRRGWVGL